MNKVKIALTGGPCGGKSESLLDFQKVLIKEGYKASIVSETAGGLLNLDYMPGVNISTFDFQNLLFKIQFIKEYRKEDEGNIVICDRGIMDAKVYVSKYDFKKIMDLNRIKENEIFDTYDSALYFRTIAYEYPKLFVEQREYETPEVAIKRDELCKSIWESKIIPVQYDNKDGYDIKKRIIIQSLLEKLDKLNNYSGKSLSDFYDNNYLTFLMDGINEIMDKNNVSEDKQIKTRRLIR